MKVFLVHCWGGGSRNCWRGWLADQLRAQGIEVIAPDLPNTNTPILEEWLSEIRNQIKKFEEKEEWILVGHSLGCPFILRLLESFTQKEKIKGAILVAAFAKDLGVPEVRNFVEQEFNWKKIKSKSSKFIVINSDNDPFIELEEGKRIAKNLDGEFLIEHGAGHINEGSGFTKYPRVLELVLKLLQKDKK